MFWQQLCRRDQTATSAFHYVAWCHGQQWQAMLTVQPGVGHLWQCCICCAVSCAWTSAHLQCLRNPGRRNMLLLLCHARMRVRTLDEVAGVSAFGRPEQPVQGLRPYQGNSLQICRHACISPPAIFCFSCFLQKNGLPQDDYVPSRCN
jgi:hypothetical protein